MSFCILIVIACLAIGGQPRASLGRANVDVVRVAGRTIVFMWSMWALAVCALTFAFVVSLAGWP